jgi:anti-sigma factor RsiW
MKRFLNSCGRYRQDICLLASGALLELERSRIEEHLAMCAGCRDYYQEIKTVTVPLANYAENFAHLQPGPATRTRWANEIRQAAGQMPVRRLTPAMAFREWWREVISPCHRFWTGLAAVWVVILVGHLSLDDHAEVAAWKSHPSSQAMIKSFKDQQKILTELLADDSAPRDAERQKFPPQKPRTEYIRVETM